MILVTGGTGYIGSHMVTNLLKKNLQVLVIDNLSNSYRNVLEKIKLISNKNFYFEEVDIRDCESLEKIFRIYKITEVIHFAALKSVDESFIKKDLYFENNIQGTANIIYAMNKANVKKMIFSSSAAVYGEIKKLPIDESHITKPISPYAETKLKSERLLQDTYKNDNDWSIVCLRYFNPAGSHPSYELGENPKSISKNLFPAIGQVASNFQDIFKIYGDDYNTTDGTCIRDYIHIMDLIDGHEAAYKYIKKKKGIEIINLGTGNGFSVKEIINRFEITNDISIPTKVFPRRQGDVACCYAKVDKAYNLLGWKAKLSIDDMCRDYWNWRKMNDQKIKKI